MGIFAATSLIKVVQRLKATQDLALLYDNCMRRSETTQ